MMREKTHAIVLPAANKQQTLDALAGASFGAAGQRCMAVSVAVLVGDARQWIPDMVDRARKMSGGDGPSKTRAVGPLIACAARERVESLIARGIEEGATLELDGRLPSL